MLLITKVSGNIFVCIRYAPKHSINHLLGFGTQMHHIGNAVHGTPGIRLLQISPALQSESVKQLSGSMGLTGRSGSTV